MLNHGVSEDTSKLVSLARIPTQEKPIDDDDEIVALIQRQRVVRCGMDAWATLSRAESFDKWCAIAAALAVGREYALRVSDAPQPIGAGYSKAFAVWLKQHRLDDIEATSRSAALELHTHLAEIIEWRDGLPEKQRRRLRHPLSNVKAWRRATGQRATVDPMAQAAAAWARLLAILETLPASCAGRLWREIEHHAARALTPTLKRTG